MQDFFAFVVRHWELWLAFVVILSYWLSIEYQQYKGGHALSTQQLVSMMNRENGAVIDLRDSEAYEKGHILGALSLPEKELLSKLNKIKKYQQKPVILIDNNGQIAPRMIKQLNKEGFMQVSYLKNGMQAWYQANLPLDKTNT